MTHKKTIPIAFLLFACASVTAPLPANAKPPLEMKGKQLLSQCMAPGEMPQTVCLSRIAGFKHGLDYMAWKMGGLFRKASTVCLPSGIKADEIKPVFIKHAQAHPADMDGSDWLALTRALEEAYPCDKKE